MFASAQVHAPERIDFPFHLFSHLYFASLPVFFYLFVDNFSEFTLMENAILSRPLLLSCLFFSPPTLNPRLPRPGLIEILLVCLYGTTDENDFVDRKKDGDGREGVGDKKNKNKKKKTAKDGKSMRDEIYQNS